MDILSQITGKQWQSVSSSDPHEQAENPTREKTAQLLTNLLLSENLLVLCGCGSCLYLNDNAGNRIAPTMKDLWDAAKARMGNRFGTVLDDARYRVPNEQDGNIEDLLSHCQIVLQLEEKESIRTFVQRAEEVIAERCRFPTAGVVPYAHESFLRKVARRSPRLPRTRIFLRTTTYASKSRPATPGSS